MVAFAYGIISHWYITVMVTALVVVYWVFQGLSEAGILQSSQKAVFGAFEETKAVARYCVPKLGKWEELWACLENPPKYEATKEETALKEALSRALSIQKQTDPYENY